MTELNRFIINQFKLTQKMRVEPLIGYTNQKEEPATWDDPAWKYTLPNGNDINYFFTNGNVIQPRFLRHFDDSKILSSQLRHLLMLYAINVNASSKLSISNKRDKLSSARQFLIACKKNPANLDSLTLQEIFDAATTKNYFTPFCQWLVKGELIPATIKIPTQKGLCVRNAGHDITTKKLNKVPASKLLLALGAISHDVIPSIEEEWSLDPFKQQRDAYICTMSSLAMASPNRVEAEQTVLVKQVLKELKQVIDGSEKKTHYLDWPGSKGFNDYQNHILSVMSEAVDRNLRYINKVCEPGRVLARFYENPDLILKKILMDFQPSQEKLNAIGANLNKPVHLLHLGYLLGFYDQGNGKIRLNSKVQGCETSQLANGHNIYTIPIERLGFSDELVLSYNCPYGKFLLGANIDVRWDLEKLFGGEIVTVEAFQTAWINYQKRCLKGFPIGSNGSKHGCIKYSQALFCFTGRQIYNRSPSYKAGKTNYALAPLDSLGNIFTSELTSPSKSGQCDNIFLRYNFSKEFHLTPHQLRHWLNDTADREGVAHTIINLWSGRISPEQLLNYVHRTHDEKASEIADILFNEKGKNLKGVTEEVKIRVLSKRRYDELTRKSSAITATGLCTQNLQFDPCKFLNDFTTQCTLCPSSCHINGDEDAIGLMKKDCSAQKRRLATIKNHQNFTTSKAMQSWFTIHHRNTSMLEELIGLMCSPDIDKGSIIRVLSETNEIRITDLKNKIVKKRTLSLPCSESALKQALAEKTPDIKNKALDDILELMGDVK